MAAPTAGNNFPYPHHNSPSRQFYQAGKSGATNGTFNVMSTISSTKSFVLTNAYISIYAPTAAATLELRIKSTTVANFSGASIGSYTLDLWPGIVFNGMDTQTAQLIVTGNTVGATSFIMGYFD